MRKIGKARLKELAKSLEGKLTAEDRDEMIAGMSDIRDEMLKLKARVEEFHNMYRPITSLAEKHFHYVDELTGIGPSYLQALADGQDESIELLEKVYAAIEGIDEPQLEKEVDEEAVEFEKKKDAMDDWLRTRNKKP